LAAGGASVLAQVARGDEASTPVADAAPGRPADSQSDSKTAIRSAEGIPLRTLGKTGRKLPILAMGGSAMVRMFIKSYGAELLSTEDRIAMVRHCYDSGVRYFDTARVYGESESIMGQGLKGVRQNCYVATKMHESDPAKVRACVEKSLEQLGMDQVDCVQVHSPAIERVGFAGGMKLHAELVKLRDEGLLKYIGLTTHIAFEPVLRMIDTGGFDQVLLAYGYFRKGMDTMLSNRKIETRQRCLARAHELGMGIVAMKVLGANIFSHNAVNVAPDYDRQRMAQLPAASIRWVLQDPRVSILNIGVTYPADVDKNLKTLRGDLRFTLDDRELLADFSAAAYDSPLVQGLKVT
jgi:aryl-alcohol dehydrogenase-like predicted oxidoreductase